MAPIRSSTSGILTPRAIYISGIGDRITIIGQEKLESKAIGGIDTPPLFDWLSMIVGYLKGNSNDLKKIKEALF